MKEWEEWKMESRNEFMVTKWLAIREGRFDEEAFMAKSSHCGGVNAPACRVRYRAGGRWRADTCSVGWTLMPTTADLRAVPSVAFNFVDACLFFWRPPK